MRTKHSLATFTLGLAMSAFSVQPSAFSLQRAAGGPADEATPPELNEDSQLGDYLLFAAAHNPGLRAAFERWQAALNREVQARTLPDPRVGYGHYLKDIRGRLSDRRQVFRASQEFPWFGKLGLEGDMARQEAVATERVYDAARLRLFAEVKSVYAEYYYLSRSLAVSEENIELMKYLEQVVRTRYAAGAAGHPDVIKAQVELGKLENERRMLGDMRPAVSAKLNATLGRPPEIPISWPRALPEEPIAAESAELLAALRAANPELQAMAADVAKEESAVRRAHKNYYPDLMLELEYMDMRSRGMPDEVMGMVSVNLPIWRAKYRAGEREAQARLRSAQRMLEDRRNLLGAEAAMALYGVRDAQRRIGLYRDTLLPKAKESLKAVQTAFAGGKAMFLDVLDAQRVLLEFGLAYERALADHVQRRGELERLIGREIPAAATRTEARGH